MPLHRRAPTPIAAALAFAGLLLAARTAAAQDGGVATGAKLESGDFFIGVQAEPGANLSDFKVQRFFNKAACDCDLPVYIYVTLVQSGFAKRNSITRTGSIEFWVGNTCDNVTLRGQKCKLLKSELLSQFLNQGKETLSTNARVMSTYTNPGVTGDGGTDFTFFPDTGNPTCTLPVDAFSQSIYVLIDTAADGIYDTIVKRDVYIDLTPPPPPPASSIVLQGGNQAIDISWEKLDTAVYTDVLGYQVLCDRGGELQVFSDGTFTPGFFTCPTTITGNGVTALDPRFVCSPLLTASATNFRVKLLQNDIPYGVSVVTVDQSGNASAPDVFYGTPIKTKSFYDVYRDGNTGSTTDLPGSANGGFCGIAPGARPAGLALGGTTALAAVAAVLLARRRRGR